MTDKIESYIKDVVITNKGRELVMKLLATGIGIEFTRAFVGTKTVEDTTNLKQITEMVAPHKEIPVAVEKRLQETDQTTTLGVMAILRTIDIKEPFEAMEVGLYAKLHNTNEEVLFAYTAFRTAQVILPASVFDEVEEIYYFDTTLSQSDNIIVTADDSKVYALRSEIQHQFFTDEAPFSIKDGDSWFVIDTAIEYENQGTPILKGNAKLNSNNNLVVETKAIIPENKEIDILINNAELEENGDVVIHEIGSMA